MRRLHVVLVALLVLIWSGAAQPVKAQTGTITIKGAVTWSQSRQLTESVIIASAGTLVVAPGVELSLRPGVTITVESGGTFITAGTETQRVRLANVPGQPRWEGIFGRADSTILLAASDLVGGGAGGTLIASEAGRDFQLTSARILDSGGQIRMLNTPVTIKNTELAGSTMPYGAAVDVRFNVNGPLITRRFVNLEFNRIEGNQLAAGAPVIRIANEDRQSAPMLNLVGNFVEGHQGPELTLIAEGPLSGNILCNTLTRGTQGVRLESVQSPPNYQPALNLRLNVIERHLVPPNNPTFQQLAIGLGASSDLSLDVAGNWWGHTTGPFAPNRNSTGRGDLAGINIQFQAWLTERPACAP